MLPMLHRMFVILVIRVGIVVIAGRDPGDAGWNSSWVLHLLMLVRIMVVLVGGGALEGPFLAFG